MTRGFVRVAGLARVPLAAGLMAVAANIRELEVWAARHDGGRAQGHPLHKPQGPVRRAPHEPRRSRGVRGGEVQPHAEHARSRGRKRRRRRPRHDPRPLRESPGPGTGTFAAHTADDRGDLVERVTGIEPALSAWEADVLPLNYTRGVAPASGGDALIMPQARDAPKPVPARPGHSCTRCAPNSRRQPGNLRSQRSNRTEWPAVEGRYGAIRVRGVRRATQRRANRCISCATTQT